MTTAPCQLGCAHPHGQVQLWEFTLCGVLATSLPHRLEPHWRTMAKHCRCEIKFSPGFHQSCPVKGWAIPVVRGVLLTQANTRTQVQVVLEQLD